MSSSTNWSNVQRLAVYALTGLGVFWLPYSIPSKGDAYSLARFYHFNNYAAIVAMILGVCDAAWLIWRENTAEPAVASTDERGPAVWALATLLILRLPSLVLMTAASKWWDLGEARFFVVNMLNLDLGLKPYRDFQFSYGPALLYLPWAIHRITRVSAGDAYLCALWFFSLAGIAALWWLIRQAAGSRDVKTIAFILLAIPSTINLELGVQYTICRWILGFIALVLLEKWARKNPERPLPTAGVAVALTLLVFAVSPELGLAAGAGIVVYFLLGCWHGSRWMLKAAGFYVLVFLILLALLPAQLFAVQREFLRGGGAFPLFPAPALILYVLTMLLIVPSAAVAAIRGSTASWRYSAAITGAFAFQALGLTVGAFGRADPGHVFMYGYIAFLLALLREWPRKWNRLAYVAVFAIVFPLLIVRWHYRSSLSSAWNMAMARIPAAAEQSPEKSMEGRKILGDAQYERSVAVWQVIQSEDLERYYPRLSLYKPICDPYGYTYTSVVLARHGNRGPTFYWRPPALIPEVIAHEIQDLEKSCPYALLPREALDGHMPEFLVDQKYLSELFAYPVPAPSNQPPPSPERDLSAYLNANYSKVAQLTPSLALYARRGATVFSKQ